MSVETFTREQFESILTALLNTKSKSIPWQHIGLTLGEHCYIIPIAETNKRLYIRSSVKSNGRSADTGDDSIRLYVQYQYKDNWYVLGKQTWTQRTPGWQTRMGDKLRKLYAMALQDSQSTAGRDSQAKREIKAKNEQGNNESLPGVDGDTPTGGEANPLVGSVPAPPQAPPGSPFSLGGAIAPDGDEEQELEQQAPESSAPQPNPQQLAAIEAPVNSAIRVLAGPGSGKTFCVARRYAYLLANGARPDDILAVTFNKTMADELLARIIKVNPSVRGTAAEKQVSTIHALCFRLLRAEGDRRSVAKEWQVKRILTNIAEKLWPYADNRPGYKEVLSWVNSAKMQGLTTANDLDFFSKCIDKNGVNVGSKLHAARQLFDQGLQRNIHYKTKRPESLLTFSDMLLDVEQKLKLDRSFREKVQARFKWVIIDEFQDTSAQAMRILTTIAKPQDQFSAVGDGDQMMYRFAGATPEANLYEGFEARYPDGKLIKLSVNYRSTKEIIKAQLALIEYNYHDLGGPYDQKYLKALTPRPDAPQGQPVSFQMHINPQWEARAVVASIQEHLASGGQPGDIFIGARTRAQLGYLEGPLTRAQIPSINLCGGSFWSSKHIQDVICYLRLAHDETDSEAFKRVYNIASNNNTKYGKPENEYCHHRYLGAAFLSLCDNRYTGLDRAAASWRFKAGARDLEYLLYGIQTQLEEQENLGATIQFIIDECYKKYLNAEEGHTADSEDSSKLDDLQTVIDIANQFDTADDFIEYVLNAQQAVEDKEKKDWGKYVILSTIHRLKGLERPVVFGIGLSEGVGADGTTPAGLLPHTFSMIDPPRNGVLPTGGRGRIADDRCCCFVLVSRAKQQVHLSGVEQYRKSIMGPSRFIEEMGQ